MSDEKVAESYETTSGRKMALYYRKKRRKDAKVGKQDGKVQELLVKKE